MQARIVIPKGSSTVLLTMLLISILCYVLATVAGSIIGTTTRSSRSHSGSGGGFGGVTKGSKNDYKKIIRYELLEEGEFLLKPYRKYGAIYEGGDSVVTTLEWTESLLQQNEDGDHDVDASSSSLEELIQLLKNDVPYDAYYFEVKPVSKETVKTQQFEFVVMDVPTLHKRKSPTFSKSFQKSCDTTTNKDSSANSFHVSNEYGCIFTKNDSTINVPKPQPSKKEQVDDAAYKHIGNFIKLAPSKQVNELWKFIAMSYQYYFNYHLLDDVNNNDNKGTDDESEETTLYLSTAGNGIPWLHFRFDTTSQYYRYSYYNPSLLIKPTTSSGSGSGSSTSTNEMNKKNTNNNDGL